MLFPTRTLSLLCAVALLPIGGALAQDTSATLEEARQAFKSAYAQVDAAREPQDDSELLRNYPLYPYLQAARIRRALADAVGPVGDIDRRAASFTSQHEHEPAGRSLRRVWLASLAKRQQWGEFLDHYRDQLADSALECQYFDARIALGRTEGLAPRIAAQWLSPKSLPDCLRPFEWLRAQNALTPELIEQRVRLALKDNNIRFARQLAGSLPPERAAAMRQWASLLEHPQDQIDALIGAPGKSVEPEALLAGWSRLARRNRDAAIERYDALVRTQGLAEDSASPYALALALPLSWDRRAHALYYFRQVKPADLDDSALEWQARAALWAQDWSLVARSISAMSKELREHARWRYWAARAAERTGDPKLAQALYQSVLANDNFYSMMAAARLDQPLEPHPETLVQDSLQIEQIERAPAFVRARELLRLEMRGLAQAEWVHGRNALPETARDQTIHLAARWGWYDQAVATATQQRVFNDYGLLYPQPFDREVDAAAKFAGIPAELVYSVMRQESLYRSDAVSSAGARGLMQMLPETARRTARNWKQPSPQTSDLFDPRINVLLGAAHLRELIDRFDGQTIVALAGYNAGPGASNRWLPGQSIEPDVWIENIPYNETRNYVQRILWHNLVFAWLKSGKAQKTDIWLARVMPLGEKREAALSP